MLAIQLVAILLAFILGFFLVGIFGFDPFEVYGVLWSGSLGSVQNVGWSLQNMTPLVFTGLAVALSFKAGLFNIGAEGQLVAGAFCAAVVGWAVPAIAATPDLSRHGFWDAHWYTMGSRVLIGLLVLGGIALCRRTFEEPDEPGVSPRSPQTPGSHRETSVKGAWMKFGIGFALLVAAYFAIPPCSGVLFRVLNVFVFPLALLTAAAGGAAWAFVPAWLRARLGVSEVINTIMFNFIASALAAWLLTTPTFKAPGAIPQTPAVGASAQHSKLARFVPGEALSRDLGSSQLNTGFLLALIAAAAVGILMTRTTLGYELRAIGSNATAAAASGIPVERNVMLAMLFSGALAGLGGAEQVLGVHHHFVKDFWTGLGFTGIAVALVGRNQPAGVLAAALLFGALQNGAVEIDMMTLFPRELILVLQALIIFFVASGPVLADWIGRRKSA